MSTSAPFSLPTLFVAQGGTLTRTLQLKDLDGSLPTQLLATDTLSGTVFVGQAEAAAVSFTPTWVSATAGTVQVSLTATQTASLSVDTTYNLQVFVTRSGITYLVGWCWLLVGPAAGSQVAATPADLITYPYLSQMLGAIVLTQPQAEQLPTLVSAASAAVRSWCNRTITQNTYVETVPVSNVDGTVRLRETPVNFVSRVQNLPVVALSVSNTAADSAWVSVNATGDVITGQTIVGLYLNDETAGVTTQTAVDFATNMTITGLATAISAVSGWSATASTDSTIANLPVTEIYDLFGSKGAGANDAPYTGAEFHVFSSNITNSRPHPDDGQRTGVWWVGVQYGNTGGIGPQWGPDWMEFDGLTASPGVGVVKVTYNGGFAAIPREVQLATVELIKHELDRLKSDLTLASESAGDYSYTLRDQVDALPRHVLQGLSRYRNTNA